MPDKGSHLAYGVKCLYIVHLEVSCSFSQQILVIWERNSWLTGPRSFSLLWEILPHRTYTSWKKAWGHIFEIHLYNIGIFGPEGIQLVEQMSGAIFLKPDSIIKGFQEFSLDIDEVWSSEYVLVLLNWFFISRKIFQWRALKKEISLSG